MSISTKDYFKIIDIEKQTTGASLIFDLSKIESNMLHLKRLEKVYNCKILMATKSFPNIKVINLAHKHLSGFDISNINEFKLIPKKLLSKVLWISSPALSIAKIIKPIKSTKANFIFSVNSEDQIKELHRVKNCKYTIRLDTSSFLNTNSKFRIHSRFGFNSDDPQKILDVISKSKNHFIGFHFHHGFEQNTIRDYVKMAKVAYKLSQQIKIPIKYINLGGGLVHLNEKDLNQLLFEIRKFLPRSIILVFEPGRFLSKNAGFAVGHCISILQRADKHYICTLDLSRTSHLMWSYPYLLTTNPKIKSKNNLKIEFVGPTCYEFDRIAEIYEDNHQNSSILSKYKKGSVIIFSNISGYSVAWNRSFNGIPNANILFFNSNKQQRERTKK